MTNKHALLLKDQCTIPICVSCLTITVLGATDGFIPYWLDLVIVGISVIAGIIYLAWRRSKIKIMNQDDRDSDSAIQETALSNVSSVALSEVENNIGSDKCWAIIDNTLRKNQLVAGEGPILLIGVAEVEARLDDRFPRLYYCYFIDRDNNRGYSEFRIPTNVSQLIRRHCSLRLSPGDIVACEHSWSSDSGTPLNNVLSSSTDLEYSTWRLLSTSESIVFYWEDTYTNLSAEVEYTEKYRIIVPTRGLSEVEKRLSNMGSRVFFSSSNSTV